MTTVGLAGPPSLGAANAPPSVGGPGEAKPFAGVLQGQGPQPPPVAAMANGEPPGPQPGSLDLQALLQALLGQLSQTSSQTEPTDETQLDRTTGVGTNGIDDQQAAMPDLGPLMAVMQHALPVLLAAAEQTPHGAAVAASRQVPVGPAGPASAVAHAVVEAKRGLPTTAVSSPQAPTVVPSNLDASTGEHVAAPAIAPAVATTVPADADPIDVPAVVDATPAVDSAVDAAVATVTEEAPASEAETVDPIVEVAEALTDEAEPAETRQRQLPDHPAAASPRSVEVRADGQAQVTATQPLTSRPLEAASTAPAADTGAPTTEADVFTAELASTVRRATLLGDRELRLLLNPPELGHLDVRIVESPDGLRVVLEATSAEARELIERQLPALRAGLEARDLRIDRLQVERPTQQVASGAGNDLDGGMQHGMPDHRGSDGTGRESVPWSPVASLAGGRAAADGGPNAVAAATPAGSRAQAAAANGRVDVLV
jgi:flagellar hook-length control protein FliK